MCFVNRASLNIVRCKPPLLLNTRVNNVVKAQYSFFNIQPKHVGRRNHSREKKRERKLGTAVDGLIDMPEKQLRALEPLLGQEILEAVRLAGKLPHTTHGRRRQEGLVARMLRDTLDETAIASLLAAVEMALTSGTSYVQPRIASRVERWREGLLGGEQAIVEEVMSVLTRVGTQRRPSPQITQPDACLDSLPHTMTSTDRHEGEVSPTPPSRTVQEDKRSGTGMQAAPIMQQGQLPDPQQLRALIRQLQVSMADPTGPTNNVAAGTSGLIGRATAAAGHDTLHALDTSLGMAAGSLGLDGPHEGAGEDVVGSGERPAKATSQQKRVVKLTQQLDTVLRLIAAHAENTL